MTALRRLVGAERRRASSPTQQRRRSEDEHAVVQYILDRQAARLKMVDAQVTALVRPKK